MMKWVIIFLVLVNALVLFGFSMLSGDSEQKLALDNSDEMQLIRLVSESEQLARSPARIDLERPNEWVGECYWYGPIAGDDRVTRISDFLVEQGLEPVIINLDEETANNVFYIQVEATAERKMISKINEILQKNDMALKIEKKVCKGVASLKRDQ